MAPYLVGLDYKALKQLAQTMFFELGEMYVARGGQTVFSSVSLEPGIPKTYSNIPAVGPKGKIVGVYGNYEEEATRFFDAIIDVALRGDYMGKSFNWPKLEIRLEPEWLEKYEKEYLLSAKLAAKFGSAYFFNAGAPYMPGEMVCVQCCRYYMQHSDWNDEKDLDNGTLRGGVMQNVTINLPQCAYEANGDDSKLFEEIELRMNAARDVSLIKTNEIKKRLVEGFLPFLSQPVDDEAYKVEWYDYKDQNGKLRIKSKHNRVLEGTPYLEPDRHGITVGVLGLNEALKAHVDEELHESKDAWRFGLKITQHMRNIVEKYTAEIGTYFGLVQSPAESAAVRLAQIDLKRYKEKAAIQGNSNNKENGAPSVFYTNSTHVNVSAQIPLAQRIRLESSFHPLFNGGTIMHIFLNEAYPDPTSLWNMTKKIMMETLTGYFAYTKDTTICKPCKKVHFGLLDKCPECGAQDSLLEHWSRITGYYQEVSGWNAGKREELRKRQRYTL
jgi:ribonucleoside-triphosphate reductase